MSCLRCRCQDLYDKASAVRTCCALGLESLPPLLLEQRGQVLLQIPFGGAHHAACNIMVARVRTGAFSGPAEGGESRLTPPDPQDGARVRRPVRSGKTLRPTPTLSRYHNDMQAINTYLLGTCSYGCRKHGRSLTAVEFRIFLDISLQ